MSARAATDIKDRLSAAFLDATEESNDMLGWVTKLVALLTVEIIPTQGNLTTPIP